MTALVVHLPLMLIRLPLSSYDANFHIFFASHYLHHWFNPWNTKWYAGFSQTTYPPLPQQWMAVILVLPVWIWGTWPCSWLPYLLLVVGIYRFSLFMGESPRRIVRSIGVQSFWARKAFWFIRRPTSNHGRRAALPERAALFVRLGETWKLASFLESRRAVCCRGCSAPRHAAVWIIFLAVPVLALVLLDRQGGQSLSRPAFS